MCFLFFSGLSCYPPTRSRRFFRFLKQHRSDHTPFCYPAFRTNVMFFKPTLHQLPPPYDSQNLRLLCRVRMNNYCCTVFDYGNSKFLEGC
uniref:Uncharacterized protein n=1 Tax=Anopheles aquasalis TaxID=42839 RepID=T1DP68_ANOAQ